MTIPVKILKFNLNPAIGTFEVCLPREGSAHIFAKVIHHCTDQGFGIKR